MPRPDASPSTQAAGVPWLRPEWPVPPAVQAIFTLRGGGVSASPFDSLNVGAHVQDEPAAVAENRRRIAAAFELPQEPAWLSQGHGNRVVTLGPTGLPEPGADAVITEQPGRVCAIQVADCLPVLFAARDGSAIGAAHAGWRGLAAGVLEKTVIGLGLRPAELLAWIGPGIGSRHFEVGPEVREAFVGLAHSGGAPAIEAAFVPNGRGHYLCDLVALARLRLTALGLTAVYGGHWCTYSDAENFYSYRRDGRTGRMAALIWLAQTPTNVGR